MKWHNPALTQTANANKMVFVPYIIDGHNLIPKVPGLRLDALEDEKQLVEVLQEFCRLRRKQAEVYFDNAPPGQARVTKHGSVVVRFVRTGTSADEAIRLRLQRIGSAARNWTVVSSDQAIQVWARAARAQVQSSEEFARLLVATLQSPPPEAGKQRDVELSPDEIDDWLDLFGSGKPKT